MLCEFELKPMPVSNKTVGIDLSLTDLFITSDGKKSGNPRHTQRYEHTLAHLQRQLAKKQKGSNNQAKTRLQIAHIHAKIAGWMLPTRHPVHSLTKTKLYAVESFNLKGMIRNPKLAKHFFDANWGEFVRQLKYKAEHTQRTGSVT